MVCFVILNILVWNHLTMNLKYYIVDAKPISKFGNKDESTSCILWRWEGCRFSSNHLLLELPNLCCPSFLCYHFLVHCRTQMCCSIWLQMLPGWWRQRRCGIAVPVWAFSCDTSWGGGAMPWLKGLLWVVVLLVRGNKTCFSTVPPDLLGASPAGISISHFGPIWTT